MSRMFWKNNKFLAILVDILIFEVYDTLNLG